MTSNNNGARIESLDELMALEEALAPIQFEFIEPFATIKQKIPLAIREFSREDVMNGERSAAAIIGSKAVKPVMIVLSMHAGNGQNFSPQADSMSEKFFCRK